MSCCARAHSASSTAVAAATLRLSTAPLPGIDRRRSQVGRELARPCPRLRRRARRPGAAATRVANRSRAAAHHRRRQREAGAAQLRDRIVLAAQAHERHRFGAAFGHARGGAGQRQRRVLRQQHRADAEMRGRAQDRAEVVRIADAVQPQRALRPVRQLAQPRRQRVGSSRSTSATTPSWCELAASFCRSLSSTTR